MPDPVPEPGDGTEREILLGWLAFHRDALRRKCAGVTDEELATRSVPPSPLSLLGLMRHLTEMERVYGTWALGPDGPLEFVFGDYPEGGPEPDIDADPSMVAASREAWRSEMASTDARIASHDGLDSVGGGNRRTVRWNLTKLIGEYARHNGHADLLRETIDGATGE